jgi:hypothetical protein
VTSFAIAVAIVMILQMGCQNEFMAPTGDVSSLNLVRSQPLGYAVGDSTVTGSAVLYPDSALNLTVLQSHITYLSQSVVTPTVVSMTIRDLDTTGVPLLPRCVVFGPDHEFRFLRTATIHMSAVDAGLAIGEPNNSNYMLYRLNETTGRWEFHDNPVIKQGAVFNFYIRRNGVYALGPLDTSWTTSGLVSPDSGGTLNLLSSMFSAPAGAVASPTVVTFTIFVSTPEDLPGATDRIFDFEPEGLTFETPCIAYISFADAGIMGEKIPPLHCYYFDAENFAWVRQETSIDWQRQKFIVRLHHFSRYAFGR